MIRERLTGWVFGLALIASPALAHDFWLQPEHFTLPVGAVTPLTIQVGHAQFRTRWSGQLERVVQFRDISAAGSLDERADLSVRGADQDAKLSFATPGTHLLVFESNHAESNLPAIRFNDYVAYEGVTPAIQYRVRTKTTDQPGREIYSRRCKALIQVGPPTAAAQPWVTRPVGLTLEIVPERNPYTLGPRDPLPVQVFYEGKPLAGALVKLTSLEFDRRPVETHLSDAQGRAAFTVPRTGTWLINVIWSKPIKGVPNADFDTTFSSLTFSFWR